MLNVAIAIDAPPSYGLGPDAAAAVSGACEEVIGAGRCPVAAQLPRGAVAAWFALVHPDDEVLARVRIEFRDRTADGVLIEERTLVFGGAEDLRARLVSVGAVIAALAAAREGAITPVRPPPPLPVAEPRAAVASAALPFDFDVAALAVPALGGGSDRFGGFTRTSFDVQAHLLLTAGVEYVAHAGEPSLGWLTVLAGVGTRLAPRSARFDLELRGALVFQRVDVAASAGGAHDSGSQDGWGGRVGATLVWRPWRWFSTIAGAEGTLVGPRVAVALGAAPATELPTATCGFFIGLRASP